MHDEPYIKCRRASSTALSVGAGRQPPAAAAMSGSLDHVHNFSNDYDLDIALFGDIKNSSEIFPSYEKLAVSVHLIFTPILIILGSAGNLISLIVFYKTKLKVQSTSQYLSALAISDTLFLCQLVAPWLKAMGSSTLFARNGFCQLFVYTSYVTSSYSSWLVVSFTLERFVAVVYPLRRNVMCTVKRARIYIAWLLVAALLINLPVLRFAVPNGNDCSIDVRLIGQAETFNFIDTGVSFTMPLAVIVVLNSWITARVMRVGRTRGNLMRQGRHCRTRVVQTARPPRHNGQRSQQRVTRMLLIVSSVFVMLNLPAYSMRIVAYANDMGEREYSGKWAALQQICQLLFNTNFGINFILYCLTGQNFRRSLLETFPWLRRRKNALVALNENTNARPARASSLSTSYSFSNHTEATSNCVVNNGASTSGTGRAEPVHTGTRQAEENRNGQAAAALRWRERRRSQQVIQRWRFDNTRQQRRRRRRESFELREVPPPAPLPSDNM